MRIVMILGLFAFGVCLMADMARLTVWETWKLGGAIACIAGSIVIADDGR